MKSKVAANISLKIISLLFAIVLWMVVNNMENPTISRSYGNIPVKLINTELITDAGKVYEVADGTDIVDKVTIWAPKSVFSSLDAGNIIATADVSELSSLDTISIKFSTSVYNSEIENIKGSIDTVKLDIENKRTKTLALKTAIVGTIENGYIVGEVTTDQNLIRISGPESIVNEVTKAVVEVDVTDFTSDIGTNLEVRLYDAEDNLIQNPRISQNIKSVGVNVGIYQTLDIPIRYNVTGTPAYGYRISGEPQSNPETITVAGKSSVLKNISAIEIPEGVIDVSGESKNYVTEIDIRDYLPENVFLADSSLANVEVTVAIQQEVSKRLEIRGEKVRVTNVPEGYRASISDLGESFTIEVIGLSSDVSVLRANDIEGKVDVAKCLEDSGMEEPAEGYYETEVDFGLGDNVTLLEPITVVMHLSKITE